MTAEFQVGVPTVDQLRDFTRRHGLSGVDVAELIHISPRRWRQYAGGERDLSPAAWELMLIKMGDHPNFGPTGDGDGDGTASAIFVADNRTRAS